MIVSLQTKFRGHAGHYADRTGSFTDKCGHWPKKFVSDEPFELILSYEIVVITHVTIAELSAHHKDGIILCTVVAMYVELGSTTLNAPDLTKRSERLCVSTS